MASKIIGRRACYCGFEHAHVKESDKCVFMHCPSCGMNGPHARTDEQRAALTKGMRPEGSQHSGTPTPTEPKAAAKAPAPLPPTPTPTERREPEPKATPTPAKARGSGFLAFPFGGAR